MQYAVKINRHSEEHIAVIIRVKEQDNQETSMKQKTGNLRDLLFNPEDRGNMFLRNVGLSLNYTAFLPEHRRFHNHRLRDPVPFLIPIFGSAIWYTFTLNDG
jgi:hypothetical protein